MAKQTKTFGSVTTVSTINSTQFFPLTDADGNITKISLTDLKAALLDGIDLDAINDGVFIMYHANNDDYPRAVRPYKWSNYQNSGEIADGVLVAEGGRLLVVAPTEATLRWSSAEVNAGGVVTSNRLTALSDWDGKANTSAHITHAECNTESYAPGFCASYSRQNANGEGLKAGDWWQPSLAEMLLIYANMRKINHALSQINGATQLAEAAYWTSTQYSSVYAWHLSLSPGYANGNTKATIQLRVRPVSAFIV